VCASVLLFTWGLPHTIALRNAMLGLGGVASLYFLIKYKPFVLKWNATPLILMYCLPVWVLIHYWFFAQEPDLEWLEIKSLWVRVFAGMLIATAMGVLIRIPSRMNSLFIFSFFGMSISIISVYLFQSWSIGHLLTHGEFYGQYLFDRNKVSAAFFGTIDLAMGCAILYYLMSAKEIKNFFGKSIVVLLMMGVSISASVVANSKNGIGIGAILITFFLLGILILVIRTKDIKKRIFGLFLITAITLILGSALAIHKRNASPGWTTLISDIQTSIKIDEYQAWRGPVSSKGEQYPKNDLGFPVAGNTYERYSWMIAGIREIMKHPWGYGLINHQSFPRWLKTNGISFDHWGSTHAGWVDLGLSFGLPAILIVFSSIVILFIITFKAPEHCLILPLGCWISLAIFLAGFVQEITYQHTFEAMLFMITFCSTCCVSLAKITMRDRALAGIIRCENPNLFV
jgi:hypothetical protein